MVKDHSDSEKGNPLPPHGLIAINILINSRELVICVPWTRLQTYIDTVWRGRHVSGVTELGDKLVGNLVVGRHPL